MSSGSSAGASGAGGGGAGVVGVDLSGFPAPFVPPSETSVVMDGTAVSALVRSELKERVSALVESSGVRPGLGVVLVGDRADSRAYVRMKKAKCAEVGIEQSASVELAAESTEEEVIAAVRRLNEDDSVHGILVQLPLPAHVDESKVLQEISFEKDVDGLHPLNAGLLALRGREPRFVACTPRGCMELLRRYGVEVEGKDAVVLGRSNIVGVPMVHLLAQANATVTMCHSRTKDLAEKVRRADIVVAAIGSPFFVKAGWLKPGAVVIDVGINSIDDPSTKKGYRLVGDVDYHEAKLVASYMTPVPKGVGPMTIAMLLQNTVEAAERAAAAKAGEE